MPAFVTFGRILFAVLFIYTGATKLFPLQATADFIATKVVVPESSRLRQADRDGDRHDHAATAGDRGRRAEIIAGVMIALNFGARFFAML